jgi:hypothetical protein
VSPTPARDATAALTAAMCGLLFVLGAAPGVTWLDAGELGASAWELGIAHPPGYPVFALGHKAAMLLLPFGDVGFRGNLASAIIGALALGLLVAAGRRAVLPRAGLMAAAALVAVTPAFALHAVTIEVYTGVALLVAAWLWLLGTPPPADAPDRRPIVAGAFLTGLALGHHAELRPLALPFVVTAAFGLRSDRRAWSCVLVAALAGALVVLYLPLRSAAEPWRDWGHPATPAALWDHLMGARIRAAYGDQMGRLAWADAARFGREVVLPLGPALPLALVAVVLTLRQRLTRLLLVVLLLDALYAVIVNPMGLRDLQNGLPSVAAFALLAVVGVEALAARLPGRARLARAVGAGALLLGAIIQGPFLRGADRGLPVLVDTALAQTPPTGVISVASDNLAAGLAFAQGVEGARPDVAVLVRQHLWDTTSLAPIARRLPAFFGGWWPPASPAMLPAFQGPPAATGLRWEVALGVEGHLRPGGLAPGFPLFAPPRAGATASTAAADAARTVRDLASAGALDEPQARIALAHWFVDYGDATADQSAYDRAGELEPEGLGLVESRRAAALALRERWSEAVAAAQRAVDTSPTQSRRRALARYTLNAGDEDAARRQLDALITEEPADAEALALRGLIHARAGETDAARADFTAALAIDPQQPEARYGLEGLGGR